MKILKPELVIDISKWDYQINTRELEDGGVKAVIVKMGSNKTIDANFRKHAENVAKSNLILMAYHWDDIIYSPVDQAQWAVQTVKSSGYPVKFLWGDLEQYWINWTVKIPGNKSNISLHMQKYSETMKSLYPNYGIYTGKGFITQYAPDMKNWLGTYNMWYAQWGVYLPAKYMEWYELKQNWMPNYDLSLTAGVNPALLYGHQFTGDRVYLRGVYDSRGNWTKLDVSVFNQDFLTSISNIPIPPVPPVPTKTYMVTSYLLNVRPTPDTLGAPIRVLKQGDLIQVKGIINNWAALAEGGYVYATYVRLV